MRCQSDTHVFGLTDTDSNEKEGGRGVHHAEEQLLQVDLVILFRYKRDELVYVVAEYGEVGHLGPNEARPNKGSLVSPYFIVGGLSPTLVFHSGKMSPAVKICHASSDSIKYIIKIKLACTYYELISIYIVEEAK